MSQNQHFLILDGRCVTVREFSRSIAKSAAVDMILPKITVLGDLYPFNPIRKRMSWENVCLYDVKLKRGWWRRGPWSEKDKLVRLIKTSISHRQSTIIVYTAPHYADVAQEIAGIRQLYYVTDNFRAQAGQGNDGHVAHLESQLAHAVDLVCPNSPRTAEFFRNNARIKESKILLLNNAVREENVPDAPLQKPDKGPVDVASIPRPWALIMGNLASNVDWEFVKNVIESTPWLNWVAVGPAVDKCATRKHEKIREMFLHDHTRFFHVGPRPAEALWRYARACDVAVIPYRRAEPTRSGSSTRSYEHFAASRPIVATNGVDELNERSCLVHICDTSQAMITVLNSLKSAKFVDGVEMARWLFAKENTWVERAKSMTDRLASL